MLTQVLRPSSSSVATLRASPHSPLGGLARHRLKRKSAVRPGLWAETATVQKVRVPLTARTMAHAADGGTLIV